MPDTLSALRIRFFEPSKVNKPRTPRKPPSLLVRSLRFVFTLVFYLITFEITLALWQSGQELPRSMGIHVGAMSTYKLCRTPVAARQDDRQPLSLARREQEALCFTGDSSVSPDSVKARVLAALDVERAEAQEMGDLMALLRNLTSGGAASHRERKASQGAALPPATSSGIGMLLAMRDIALWQSEAFLLHDNASLGRARALAHRVSREAISGLIAESESLSRIDHRAPLLEWLSVQAGAPPQFFAFSSQATRKKALMSYWLLLHPVASRHQAPSDLAAINVQSTAGEAWLATMPRDDQQLLSWLDAMELLAPKLSDSSPPSF